MPTLSEILTAKIGKGGVSKASVAAKLNVSERTVENYMKGARNPKPAALVVLSKLLGFELSELSEDFEQNVPSRNRVTNHVPTKNPDHQPGQSSEVVLLKQIIELKDQIIGMQTKENNSLQETVGALTRKVEAISGRVENCNLLIQESNRLSVESNRLANEGNEFLKQLEGLAELAKSERLQEAANLQVPYVKKKDGRGTQKTGK